jgi:pimeloyl-ACP methyl ester carboxylesterase
VAALAAAGYFAAAPNQRGYAAGARPDPADHASYRVDRLIGDALGLVTALGYGERRFHLVGHDWGASLAWQIADQSPEQLASLTILSRPHPLAFNRALALPDGEQARRSQHHTRFLRPEAGREILADDGRWLRTGLTENGVPAAAIAAHLSVIGNPEAMEAALAWYRACGISRPVRRPCRRYISGATPTTRWDAQRRKAPANSSPRHICSRLCQALDIMPRTRCRIASMR